MAPRWLRRGGRVVSAPSAAVPSPAAPPASRLPTQTAGSLTSARITGRGPVATRSSASPPAGSGVSPVSPGETWGGGKRASLGDPCGDTKPLTARQLRDLLAGREQA